MFTSGVVCLWVALFVLCVRDNYASRHEISTQRDVDLDDQDFEPEIDPPGLTWRYPSFWIVTFFCWPAFVARALVPRSKNQDSA